MKVIILLLLTGMASSLETYYMEMYCGRTISMPEDDIHAGELTLDGVQGAECNVTIETWFSNRLMFYFEDIYIPPTVDCDETFLTVYDGTLDRPIHRLNKLCGSPSLKHHLFTVEGRSITFRFYNQDPTVSSQIDVVFTAFHTGYCYKYEYECNNRRCIDESANCNGFNPCGDKSDCKLSAGAVAGIVLGGIFVLAVVVTVTIVVCKRRKQAINDDEEHTPITQGPFEITPTSAVQTTPATYGIAAPQYAGPPMYKDVNTSTQSK